MPAPLFSGILSIFVNYWLCLWEWLGPGGLPGLQNLWRVALRAAVGSNSHPLSPISFNKTLKVLSYGK